MKTKLQVLFLVVILTMTLLTGCGAKKTEDVELPIPKQVVFSIGKEDVCYNEVYIYANTIKEDYESTYGAGIWSIEAKGEDGSKQTIENVTRRDVIDTIARTKILAEKAEDYEVALTGEEKDAINSQAEEFFSKLTDKDIEECGASVELVAKVYEENAIADKVYKKILKGNTKEVSEEEARMTTVYDLVFETYTLDEDGKPVPFTEDEAKARLGEANEAFNTLATGESVVIEDIVNQYGLQYASQHTLSRDDMIKEYGEKATDIIYGLKDGECSSVIETDYGYHIIKMLASTDKEATATNKDRLNDINDKAYFDELYSGWKKSDMGDFKYDSDVNIELYNKIEF